MPPFRSGTLKTYVNDVSLSQKLKGVKGDSSDAIKRKAKWKGAF